MKEDNWYNHSLEWKKGWHAYTNSIDEPKNIEEFEQKSDEWKAGYYYAIEHPFGNVVIPM